MTVIRLIWRETQIAIFWCYCLSIISQWVDAAGNLTEGRLVLFLSSHTQPVCRVPSSVWFMKQCSLPMCVSTGSGSLVRRCAPEELCLVSGQRQSAAALGPLLFFSLSLSVSVRIQTCTSIHQHAFPPELNPAGCFNWQFPIIYWIKKKTWMDNSKCFP